MNPLVWIETLAYAIARGAVRAWLDVITERATATEEVPDEADLLRKKVFAAAAAAELERQRLQPAPAQPGVVGPLRPPPPGTRV